MQRTVLSLSKILRYSLLLLDGHPWNLPLTINIFNKHISMQRTGISFEDIEMLVSMYGNISIQRRVTGIFFEDIEMHTIEN